LILIHFGIRSYGREDITRIPRSQRTR